MAWHRRGKEEIFYRSRRIGKRVHRDYVGGGEIGMIAERVDRCLRRERTRELAAQRRITEALGELLKLHSEWESVIRLRLHAQFLVRGFYQHHRSEWRRRNMTAKSESGPATIPLTTTLSTVDELRQLVSDANAGDTSALNELTAALRRNPDIVSETLDLEGHCLQQALDLICGTNAVVRKAILIKLKTIEDEIAGPGSSYGLFLVAKRVSMGWLVLQAAELLCQGALDGPAIPKRWLQFRDSAEYRYLYALKVAEGTKRILADYAMR
jgi:hypothetical protein